MLCRFALLTLWLSLVALVSPAFAQPNDPAPTQNPEPAPRLDHFALGIASLEAGDFQVAYEHLLEDYRAAPSFRTAAVLGQAAGELGRYAEAATLIANSLRAMPNDVALEVRKPIQDYLLRMQEHITTVEVIVSPAEASDQLEIELDGARVAFEAGVFLEPGAHVISAQAPGYAPVRVQLVATPGERKRELIRLSRLPPPAPPAHTEAHSANNQPHAASYPWRLPAAIVSGGLALAGAGLGGYFLFQANDADDRMVELQERLPSASTPHPCAPDIRTPNECGDLNSAVERRTSNYNAALVTLSTAAVFALSSAALWVWELTDDVSARVTVLPDGVVFGGKF